MIQANDVFSIRICTTYFGALQVQYTYIHTYIVQYIYIYIINKLYFVTCNFVSILITNTCDVVPNTKHFNLQHRLPKCQIMYLRG